MEPTLLIQIQTISLIGILFIKTRSNKRCFRHADPNLVRYNLWCNSNLIRSTDRRGQSPNGELSSD